MFCEVLQVIQNVLSKFGNVSENLIFANLMPCKFKVLATKESVKAIKKTQALFYEFKISQIMWK